MDTLYRQVLTWLFSAFALAAILFALWWFASDVIVVVIKAFEVIAWILGLMLWPFML